MHSDYQWFNEEKQHKQIETTDKYPDFTNHRNASKMIEKHLSLFAPNNADGARSSSNQMEFTICHPAE
jgi:hypothetical protein